MSKRRAMWRKPLCVFAAVALLGTLWAFSQETMPPKSDTSTDCSPCHSTDTPGLDDLIPDLKCRRPRPAEKLDESAAKPPDLVVMDQLSELYVPVVFPHGLHASMESMASGCSVCHHHGEEGKIVSCRACHEKSPSPGNLEKPSLKGAYHRQCLACHREWSHDTDCAFCHAKRTSVKGAMPATDPSDITGRLHPNVTVPEKRVYPTPELAEGTMVTFYHRDHVDLFGKRCAECHQKENCSRCHDSNGTHEHVRQDPHEDCASCHDVSGDCTQCHLDHEAPPFDHGRRTPFMLKAFHSSVACRDCHPGGKFVTSKKTCGDCHPRDWFPASFDHIKAGLALNEAHRDTECAGCHPDGLGEAPNCSACHDDKQFPKDLPGIRVDPKSVATTK